MYITKSIKKICKVLTKSALSDNRLSAVTRFTRSSLVNGTDSELVSAALLQAILGSLEAVTTNLYAFHPVLAELFLKMAKKFKNQTVY